MRVVNQGASATIDMNLKKGTRWVDFDQVTDLTVALLCDNMNVRTELTPGEHFRASGDILTLLLDKTLTVRTGRYRVLVRFKRDGQWLSFDPYAFIVVRSKAPSVYETANYGMTGASADAGEVCLVPVRRVPGQSSPAPAGAPPQATSGKRTSTDGTRLRAHSPTQTSTQFANRQQRTTNNSTTWQNS